MEGLLYHLIIIICLVPHLSFCQDEDVFDCSAKPGCQISQCDPIAPAWNQPGFSVSQKVDRNEFPITCKSKNSRSSNSGFLLNVLQGMQVNTLDIRNMKTEMKEFEELKKQNQNLEYDLSTVDRVTKQELEELKKRNQNLEYELSTIRRNDQVTKQELQELKNELLLLKKTEKITDRECFSTCKAARSAARDNEVTKLCLPVIGSTDVRCDFETDGGDWLIILRRSDGSINFDRNWEDYSNGFGNLVSEFWIGLEKLHIITSTQIYELRIDMGNFIGEQKYAKYSKFLVGSYTDKYKLTIGGYSGDAGDAFAPHDQKPFTAKDNDNDVGEGNCAEAWKGGWWFYNCYQSLLTGPYVKVEVVGRNDPAIEWMTWEKSDEQSYSLQFVEMKIRPVE